MKRGKILDSGETDLDSFIAHIKRLPQPFTSEIEGRILKIETRDKQA